MKKYLALLLVCVMLLPLLAGCRVSADEEYDPSKVGVEPFHIVTWSEIKESLATFDNVNELYTVNCSVSGETVKISRTGVGSDLDKVVADMKKEMDARPEGQRYLHVWAPAKAFRMAPEAVIYLDKGVDALKETFTTLINKCAAANVPIKGVIIDLEYVGLSTYYITQDIGKDSTLLGKIVKHPNYATEVRPLLEERGFNFYPDTSDYMSELWPVNSNSGDKYSKDRTIWNRVMEIRLAQYLNECIFEPLIAVYPDATMSDYQTSDSDPWMNLPGSDGSKGYVGGTTMKAGNVSNTNTYSGRPSAAFFKDGSKYVYKYPESYNNAVYEAKPFNQHMFDINTYKSMYLATDTHMISAWIAEYDYASRKGTVCNTPYYAETILHLGLLDPEPFLLYLYRGAFKEDAAYYSKIGPISDILHELTRVVGAADRKPIVLPVNWNYSFVLSGMYAGGKNYWRITPDMSTGVTKESFKVADATDPTFYINGQTVSFPGGKIIEDGEVSIVGTCGYWIETETNVVPIITNDADRYEKFPAFKETFDRYEIGTKLTYSNALPETTWEIKDKTQQNIVVEADKNDPNNKLLAITDTATLKNVLLPKNITAGDNYAKNQIWELTFTMPGTMPADAVITILNTNVDGGFKITADKVFYDKLGEEIAFEGVKLTPGAKYVAKRVVDFNGKEITAEDGTVTVLFSSSYYLYDAEGNVVASAENVDMKSFTLPVQKIGFACENLGANTMYVDDYTMMVTGFAANFELYEAKNGMQIADLTAAVAGETAYRYSWLNASDKEKKVQIVAQVFDAEGNVTSETVIKELVMQPGYDGVEYGVYDAKDTAVVFAVKTIGEEVEKNDNLWLYVGIGAAAVLVLAAVAAVVIVVAKKKKQ